MRLPQSEDQVPDRATNLVRLTGQATYGAMLVLAVAVLLALWQRPSDLLVLVQIAALVVVSAGAGVRWWLTRDVERRREAQQSGLTRMLMGISRSASADAVVQTIIDELRQTADADHILVARLRPVDRVVETTLVSSRARVPAAHSILPQNVLDPARLSKKERAGIDQLDPKTAAQAVADAVAARLAQTYALAHTLAVPLVSESNIIGVLLLSRRADRPWSAEDSQLLDWSAREMSAALGRAFAFEAAENRANVDALTGLPNRRYLDELLATAGPRRRSVERLGILMIDLDHFKRLNDMYGHQAGDHVLRLVAEQLGAAIRADDTAARYGGEEFAVVLRRASPEQAVEVAERIRRQISALAPSTLGTHEPVSVSIGVAVARGDEHDADRLFKTADAALYRAKREGRNRVVLAE
jgi:diguanylate cyclase (GGDEF)-like protein